MPMTWPVASKSGPPELPGSSCASVSMRSLSCSVSFRSLRTVIERFRPVTDPSVTVGDPCLLNALPMATTASPTDTCDELPTLMVGRPEAPSAWRTATSSTTSVPTTCAG